MFTPPTIRRRVKCPTGGPSGPTHATSTTAQLKIIQLVRAFIFVLPLHLPAAKAPNFNLPSQTSTNVSYYTLGQTPADDLKKTTESASSSSFPARCVPAPTLRKIESPNPPRRTSARIDFLIKKGPLPSRMAQDVRLPSPADCEAPSIFAALSSRVRHRSNKKTFSTAIH